MTIPPDDPLIADTARFPQSMWDDIREYQRSERIASKGEAVRRLMQDAIRAWRAKEKDTDPA